MLDCMCKMEVYGCFIVAVAFFSIMKNVEGDAFESSLGHIKPSASATVQTAAVQNLIRRVLGSDASKFTVQVDPNFNDDGKDAFRVFSNTSDNVRIIGTTGVAVATGFNYYLKYHCSCHISWEASQLDLPEELPQVDVTKSFNDRFRYYQNVCTTSYSYVWWDWQHWETHIDWMAMNSLNLVLAFNGQEAIWERVYKKLDMTQQEIDEHFSGPAFLSWLRMGNLRGWDGPLSNYWQNRSLTLEKQILNRMRELGIITVLPGFAGFVPRAFDRLYPEANMTKMQRWNDFNDSYCCPYLLDPQEELFTTVGTLFLEELTAEFGTDHVYNCDTFNEMTPSTSDLTYLSNIGRAIYRTMSNVDPQSVWLLQGWMFYSESAFWTGDRVEAFVTSVDAGKMIVLDLQSEQFPQYERLQQYYGQPYIWCMLHNFGGTLGMFGSLDVINKSPHEARSAANSTMIGTGLTPEGINQNYIVYDLMAEAAWRDAPANLSDWVAGYVARRYGGTDGHAVRAWTILQNTVYSFGGSQRMRGKYVVTTTPRMNIPTPIWYESSDLMDAWDLLLAASEELRTSEAYLHDVVDVTRQVLQVLGDKYYNDLITAFLIQDVDDFNDISVILLNIFRDLEAILSTNKAFMLGPWLELARNAAENEKEADRFEYDAKNQLTLWGPDGQILDYANKQWAGLMSDYYKPRWELYLSYMKDSLVNGTPFNQKNVSDVIFEKVEYAFTVDRKTFPVDPEGDTIEVAKEIHSRWFVKKHKKVERSSDESIESDLYVKNNYVVNKNYPKIITVFS